MATLLNIVANTFKTVDLSINLDKLKNNTFGFDNEFKKSRNLARFVLALLILKGEKTSPH